MQVGGHHAHRGEVGQRRNTFADVAKLMRTNGISSVVVLEGQGSSGGIVTERGIVNLVAAGGDPHSVKVVHGMTRRDLETIGPQDGDRRGRRAHGHPQHPPPPGRGLAARRRIVRSATSRSGPPGAGGWPRDAGHATSHKALQAASELQKQRRKGA